ncbi:MAG TPA: L,D-transpeptidase family protein [Jatrophihabitans sp.]|jgi:L,D-peptidoglycan transpeptidase YkuD (ErfK/YbiS/YcfS/YnhG family)|uniref:L,D-transpeptidase family protein n=1 Tax=Jatrophihabitans sp. TaxID=1932789 RepID=UPI002EF70FAB
MKASLAVLTAVLSGLAATAVAVLAPPLASPAEAASSPNQVITVQAASSTSTTARLELWQRSSLGGFWRAAGPVTAYVGRNGVGQTSEGMSRTPAGVFGLTQAFGNQPNNGTRLPYFQAGRNDWWNGNVNSPAYNTHVVQSYSPGGASENLYYMGPVYAHAVVIDYNRFPVVAGAGSAFFLHVANGRPTAGCVALDSASLNSIMRWLSPTAHPVISIGVGSQATSIITKANAAAALHNPKGYLDSAAGGRGSVRATGWAADPDLPSNPVNIDVYLDGRMRGRFSTGVARPDVAAAMRVGPNSGFALTVGSVARGTHTLCVYALNLRLGTGNPRLGCRTVTVS